MKPWIEQDSNDGEEEINQKNFRNGTNKIWKLIGNGMGRKNIENIFEFSGFSN